MRTPPGFSKRKAWFCREDRQGGEGRWGDGKACRRHMLCPPWPYSLTLMKLNWWVCQVSSDSGYVSYKIPAEGTHACQSGPQPCPPPWPGHGCP